MTDVESVGGKNASLGEMISQLAGAGVRVPGGFATNNAGGVLGGISTGQDIEVSIALKPTSSIRLPRRSITRAGAPTIVETQGRHDPCVGIRATPIAEAMLALVLIDHALLHCAQNADVSHEVPAIPASATR